MVLFDVDPGIDQRSSGRTATRVVLTTIGLVLVGHLPVLAIGYRGSTIRNVWLISVAAFVAAVAYLAATDSGRRREIAAVSALVSGVFGLWLQANAPLWPGFVESEFRGLLIGIEMPAEAPWDASGLADVAEYQTWVDPPGGDVDLAAEALCVALEDQGWDVTMCNAEDGEAPGDPPNGRLSPFNRIPEIEAHRGRLAIAADVMDEDNVLVAVTQRSGFRMSPLFEPL